jgi:hypothetical protein
MLEGLAPDLATRLIYAVGGVAVAFIILIGVLVFLKRKNSPLFVKGGRAREHRLLVLDAAAIDAKRRLVLIRRDDTEHLIMIGGPTDLVIETCINARSRQPATEISTMERQAPPQIAEEQRPALAAQPVARAIEAPRPAARQDTTQEAERMERRAERQMRRQEREEKRATPADTAGISAMGSTFYDEDRDPFGIEPPVTRPEPTLSRPVQVAAAQPVVTSTETPLAEKAEDLLDQVRNRVLAIQAQAPDEKSVVDEAAAKAAADEAAVKAMAERLEAARMEGLRAEAAKAEAARAEAQRLEAQRAEEQRAEAARLQAERAEALRLEAQRTELQRREAHRAAEAQKFEAERLDRERAEARRLESARLRAEAEKRAQMDAERRAQAEEAQEREREQAERQRMEPTLASPYAENLSDESREVLATDFEKLLEVELQKGGILDDGSMPQVQSETRDVAQRAAGTYPAPREPVSIVTGATPGLSVEQDVARRLGEISLNKKPESL